MKHAPLSASLILVSAAATSACGEANAWYAVFADQGERIAWVEGASLPGLFGGGRVRDKNADIVVWTAAIDGTRIVDKEELISFGPHDTNQFLMQSLHYMPAAGYTLVVGSDGEPGAHKIDLDGENSRIQIHSYGANVFPSRDGKYIAAVNSRITTTTEVGFTDVEKNEIFAVISYPVGLPDAYLWDEENRFVVRGIPTEAILPRTGPTPADPENYECDPYSKNDCYPRDITPRLSAWQVNGGDVVELSEVACFISPSSSGPARLDGRVLEGTSDSDEPVIRNLGAPPCVIE